MHKPYIMIKTIYTLLVMLSFSFAKLQAQTAAAKAWADSVYKTLANDERIAQLMVVRLSTIDSRTKTVTFFDKQVDSLIKKYNIGGICVFQGSPTKQAAIINSLQAKAKTPILMCIDAEWGLGMRMTDSVLALPRQMMLGAMQDSSIVYDYGKLVGEQCRRAGIQVNYAPVVDINNNPANPVINDRSFGEDKYKVASYGVAYMKGMQDVGVMACAKHFPGHGDVSVDSHFDLPVINKTMQELDSLELYPFRRIFNEGIGSVMIAHLYIPAIDSTANRATSLSPNNIKGLMRETLNYYGLTFTDALEMAGVKKFYPNGEASVQSLIAGNDMLCLPGDVPLAIKKIKAAIKAKKLSWDDIEMHCKKVLEAKYAYGLNNYQPISLNHLTADLNEKVPVMKRRVAENAITLALQSGTDFYPLATWNNNKAGEVALVSIGTKEENAFASRMKNDYNAEVFYADSEIKSTVDADAMVNMLASKFKKLVIAVHNLSRTPAANYGLTDTEISFINKLQQKTSSIIFQFGNAYAAKNWCDATNLVICYEDDAAIQDVAADMLQGKLPYKGVLPVTVCDKLKFGQAAMAMEMPAHNQWGMNLAQLASIDSIANDAIENKAAPGCVVLALKDGKIAFQKAYGFYTYHKTEPMQANAVFDMASVTKICATTLAVMKLYDLGKLDLDKKLGDYLPYVKGTDKENLLISKILLHQAGLVSYIPFYKETIDANGKPIPGIYNSTSSDSFSIQVAKDFFLANAWEDSIRDKILASRLGPQDKYVYSDNDFILLGKIAEEITGMPLDAFVKKTFYAPMGLSSIGFHPLNFAAEKRIVPTEEETKFRTQLLRGYVHDPGSAMMGGVAGHAGLFSSAYDIAAIMQMLLNGGVFNGRRYFQESTVQMFTTYQSNISRRGFGFDKPEKDNDKRKEPYPTASASPGTFGHTGFTGTCTWADPENNMVFVFLSNRVHPSGSDALLKMNVRPRIHETIYQSFKTKK